MRSKLATRPYILCLGGHDASGGAGVLADCKTAEQCGVYGLCVVTAITYQNGERYYGQEWCTEEQILNQVEPLFAAYPIRHIKIGLIESLPRLIQLVAFLRERAPAAEILVDPVLAASAGGAFHERWGRPELLQLLDVVDLLTPNYLELTQLWGAAPNAAELQKALGRAAVVLKGGHRPAGEVVYDQLISKDGLEDFPHEVVTTTGASGKHGSGCVFGAALLAARAKGVSLSAAVSFAGEYSRRFLASSEHRLGYHGLGG